MTPSPDQPRNLSLHYTIDGSSCEEEAWRAIASHHLLTSRHLPHATMSVTGISESTARRLRIFATELGLSGLRIPDDEPTPTDPLINFVAVGAHHLESSSQTTLETPADITPSVLCEAIAMLLETTGSTR